MWEVIGKISDIIGILTFLIFIFTILFFSVRAKRYKRRLRKNNNLRVALAVSLKPGENIKKNVEKFLKENGLCMKIEEIIENGVSLESLPKLRKKFIDIKKTISEMEAKEIHLFYEGPIASAFFLADALNNFLPVYIYHLHKERGAYECWGLLTESFERIATESLIKEMTKNG